MIEEELKKTLIMIFVIALAVLSFFILKPIFVPILAGLILAYIFIPVFKRLHKKIKSANTCAFIIVLGIIILLLLLAVFLIPIVTNQIIDVYLKVQNADLSAIVEQNFPGFFESVFSSTDTTVALNSLTSKLISYVLSGFQKIVLNLPSILLQTLVVLFTFFFVLRDFDKIRDYLVSISPFSKEAQARFYQKFKQITESILYGQLIVGVSQGVVSGIGYFIFGVPNALLFTFLTVIVGIIPVIGPWLVWMPIDIWLFMTGHTGAAVGLLIYGLLIINWVDNLIRPLIISRMAKMNTAIALIGMIGGLYLFGIIGLIIGPLVLAYLLLVIEFYKERRGGIKSILIEERELPRSPLTFPSSGFPIPRRLIR